MAVAYVGPLAAGIAQTSAGTSTVLGYSNSTKPQRGDCVLVACSRDNTSPEPLDDTCTDSDGNYYFRVAAVAGQTATPNAGIVGVLFCSILTNGWSPGLNTVTWSHPLVAGRAAYADHFTGVGGVRLGSKATGTAIDGADISVTTGATPPGSGDLVYGMTVVELGDNTAPTTVDTDTTNGSWSSTRFIGNQGVSGVKVAVQHKITTGSGAQTFGPIGGWGATGTVDVAGIVASFLPARAAAASLTDTFDSSLDGAKWSTITGTAPTVVAGRLRFLTQSAYIELGSVANYSLIDSAFFAQVFPDTTVGSTREFWLSLQMAGSSTDQLSIQHAVDANTNFIRLQWVSGGSATTSYIAPSSDTGNRWWRLRESLGTVYFETSSDASSWSAAASVTSAVLGWQPDDLLVRWTSVYFSGSQPEPSYQFIDNVNNLGAVANPSAATGTGAAQQAIARASVQAGAATGVGAAWVASARTGTSLLVDPTAATATGSALTITGSTPVASFTEGVSSVGGSSTLGGASGLGVVVSAYAGVAAGFGQARNTNSSAFTVRRSLVGGSDRLSAASAPPPPLVVIAFVAAGTGAAQAVSLSLGSQAGPANSAGTANNAAALVVVDVQVRPATAAGFGQARSVGADGFVVDWSAVGGPDQVGGSPAGLLVASAAQVGTATGSGFNATPLASGQSATANAGLAAGVGAANAPTVWVALNASLAAGSGSAYEPGTAYSAAPAVGAGAARPAGALVATQPTAGAGTGTGHAAVTAQYPQPQPAVGVGGAQPVVGNVYIRGTGTATGAGAALDAAVLPAYFLAALPATATGTAAPAGAALAVNSGAGTAPGDAYNPTAGAFAAAMARRAQSTGTAYQPSVTVTFTADVAAGAGAAADAAFGAGTAPVTAVGAGAGYPAVVAETVNAALAAGAGAAETPYVPILVMIGAATATGAARDATVVVGGIIEAHRRTRATVTSPSTRATVVTLELV